MCKMFPKPGMFVNVWNIWKQNQGEMLEGSIVRGVWIRLSRTMFLLRHSNSKLSSGELYTNLTEWHTLEGLNQVKYKLSYFIEE